MILAHGCHQIEKRSPNRTLNQKTSKSKKKVKSKKCLRIEKKSPNRKNISKSKKCHEIEKIPPNRKTASKSRKKMITKSDLPIKKKKIEKKEVQNS